MEPSLDERRPLRKSVDSLHGTAIDLSLAVQKLEDRTTSIVEPLPTAEPSNTAAPEIGPGLKLYQEVDATTAKIADAASRIMDLLARLHV